MISRYVTPYVTPTLCTGLLAVIGAACAGGERGGEAEEGTAMQERGMEEQAMAQAPQPPDTTAASVWAYLQTVDYREGWSHWPGKQPFYEGTEPHGMLLSTYLNDLALDALTNKAGAMSSGAIIVKENYAPDSSLAAITTMYKVEGYDPDHNDWFWAKHLPDGSVEAAGRAQGCQNCHGNQSANDYVMTASLK